MHTTLKVTGIIEIFIQIQKPKERNERIAIHKKCPELSEHFLIGLFDLIIIQLRFAL